MKVGKQIKLCFISNYAGLGGGENSLLNLIKFLNKKLFFPITVCPAEGKLTSELKKIKIDVKVISFNPIKKIGKLFIQYPIIAVIKLLRLIQKGHIEIVHANGFNSMAVAAPVTKLFNIPLLWTCHGWWPVGRLTGMFINTFVDKVIAVSDFVRNKLETEGYVHPSIIERVPLGIDLAKFRDQKPSDIIRREFGLNKNTPLIGMIARFQEIKGHHVFVRMAAEICKTHSDVRFMMVGAEVFGRASESDYARKILEMIRAFHLEANIILTGFRSDIPEILEAIDVLVVPSEVETFGMVILEAMAAGVPVVSCAKGGPTEIIKDSETGYIINEQNQSELAKKVIFLIENPRIREAMGLNGKGHVADNYQIRKQVSRVESLYLRLMDKRHYENINNQ